MNFSNGIYYGDSLLNCKQKEVDGNIVDINGEAFYCISNFDKMPPFFMTIVSSSDHWMFISSKGGLTCGRRNPENALFPYYTDDKIHDGSETTGAKTILLVKRQTKNCLWEPFALNLPNVYSVSRNLYKSILGDKIIFEEINYSLQVSFKYSWSTSDKYGFIRHSHLENFNDKAISIRLIDGIQNILPYGVNKMLQTNMSTLVDGYKKCELQRETGLGIYTLSSILTDRAEPSEALKASTVFTLGLKKPSILLSDEQHSTFLNGKELLSEESLRGKRGAYFVSCNLRLKPNELSSWIIAADVEQGPAKVPELIQAIQRPESLIKEILKDIQYGTNSLQKLVANSDGLQLTGNKLDNARHIANILFNIMRGGIFPKNYLAQVSDLKEFIKNWNKETYEKHEEYLNGLSPEWIHYSEVKSYAELSLDGNFIRLIYEYLPISFSRRHGDPSRPWNSFCIDVKNADGSQKFNYQGNWRDIFQNWEALLLSYPEFIESIISKFVNASTIDGYNPYRVSKEGIDWEILDPEDPWSNIGYWGDHQIVYLLKLLELSKRYHPGKIHELLHKEIFCFANVPYKIKSYDEIVKNAKDTIVYDEELEALIDLRVSQLGADGKLVFSAKNEVQKANLAEKLLIPLLVKISNFVPEGGIWMNTQRPEWNDANNALVGQGLSMVTLYYIRRYLNFLIEIFRVGDKKYGIAVELSDFQNSLNNILTRHRHLLKNKISNSSRRSLVDLLGNAGDEYRTKIYSSGFSGEKKTISGEGFISFFQLTLEFIDNSIRANKRDDNLFHAYNLVSFNNNSCSIEHLDIMLEGQVSVLSSGVLSPSECLLLLDSLKNSKLYRKDQYSYILYPDKHLPIFLEKNIVSRESIMQSAFLRNELKAKNTSIIEEDLNGDIHFNGSIRNASVLKELLDKRENITNKEKEEICQLLVNHFNHKHFTGRSGTFFKYEGLGCIYWHMVSKLLLAVQEVAIQAQEADEPAEIAEAIATHYREIKRGIGVKKTPDLYGAFPIDPYSHTPGFAGVQQPGMTGQVKEDILARAGELGIKVKDGNINFITSRIDKGEILDQDAEFNYYDLSGTKKQLILRKDQLAFTLCQIPIICTKDRKQQLSIIYRNGTSELVEGNTLNKQLSASLFKRENNIQQIEVMFP